MNDSRTRVFLCHASEDKPVVIEIYHRLKTDGFSPWLDVEDILPGQDWDREIRNALKSASVVLIFFSTISVSKRGYVQREFKIALDILEELPEGEIFIIPIRIDSCVLPERFRKIQYCDLFENEGFEKIVKAITNQSSELEKNERTILAPSSILNPCVDKETLDRIIIPSSVSPEPYRLKSSKSIEFILRMRETGKQFYVQAPVKIEIDRLATYLAAKLLPHLLNEGYSWTLEYKGRELPEHHTIETAGIQDSDLIYLVGNKLKPKIRPFSY